MPYRLLAAFVLVTAALTLTACPARRPAPQTPAPSAPAPTPVPAPRTQPGHDTSINVTAREFLFAPETLTVPVGQAVTVRLQNARATVHDFTVDNIPVTGVESHGDRHEMDKMAAVHTSANGGREGKVTFTPTQPGRFVFYCTVPGHREAGMQGTLVVN